MNLGLRYTVRLVTDNGVRTADTEKVFRAGDCLSLEVEANRSAYIYVLAHQSSGGWRILLPSSEAPEESQTIPARRAAAVPKGYCFEVRNPPGTDHLYVVLSRDPDDVERLSRALYAGGRHGVEVASAELVSREIDRMSTGLRNRDLALRKIAAPRSDDEPANAYYVVDGSASPGSRLVTDILIRHR
jgi:hypothetical protein